MPRSCKKSRKRRSYRKSPTYRSCKKSRTYRAGKKSPIYRSGKKSRTYRGDFSSKQQVLEEVFQLAQKTEQNDKDVQELVTKCALLFTKNAHKLSVYLEKLLELDLLVLIPSRNISSGVRKEIEKGFELLNSLQQPQLEKLIQKVAKEFESDLKRNYRGWRFLRKWRGFLRLPQALSIIRKMISDEELFEIAKTVASFNVESSIKFAKEHEIAIYEKLRTALESEKEMLRILSKLRNAALLDKDLNNASDVSTT